MNNIVAKLAAIADLRDAAAAGDFVRLRTIINFHKLATAVVATAAANRAAAPQSAIFAALACAHAAIWLDKEESYPDKAWNRSVSPLGALTFWLAAFGAHSIVAWQVSMSETTICFGQLCLAVLIWSAGIFMHFASDWQKHRFKMENPGALCAVGLWRHFSAPNYLGEAQIYLGYVLLLTPDHAGLGAATMSWMLVGVMAPELARRKLHLSAKYGNDPG